MSVSSFFGTLFAEFAKDLLFKRPVTVEYRRDAAGNTQVKASMQSSGSSPPVVYQPYGYPPPPPYPYPYGYPPQQPTAQPRPGGQEAAPSPQPQQPRPRPFILPEEFHSR